MKKTVLIIAILLGITFGGFAQEKGLFGRAPQEHRGYSNLGNKPGGEGEQTPGVSLPGQHGDANDQSPLGGGALLLIGFGAAYALKKKSKK